MTKIVLSIAGSDSSGGAGIQADLKTFEAFGVFGTTVITVLTSQNTTGVFDVSEVKSEFIKSQLKAIFDDFEVSAIKIGMLYSNEIIDTVREFIKELNIPIVFDPVCVSKSNSNLLSNDAIENLKTLFPYVTIITPNQYEAKLLLDYEFANSDSLLKIFALPCQVVIKNHVLELEKQIFSIDTLYNNREKKIFQTPYINSKNTHGTGCSYSSAITSLLALGKPLEIAISDAKLFIYEAIKNAPNIGNGVGPIGHKIGGILCQKN
jgi:hydroxymethylpyrimidine/phosphomethylpyrimidine kinase